MEGFTIRVYSDDHPPAHVHVFHGGQEIRVYLRGDRPFDRLSGRMSASDVRRALRLVDTHRDQLLTFWKRYHG